MLNEDLIAAALRQPLDWQALEGLVVDLLRADDLPAIRRVGGRKDNGLDGKEESFFEAVYQVKSVVQVTSQRAQKNKAKDTLAKLANNEVKYTRLIMVFRDPVKPTVDAEMRTLAKDAGKLLDVRDESYLLGQLARPETGVFDRHFGNQAGLLDRLLTRRPSISFSDSDLEAGILASACTFSVLSDERVRFKAIDHICLAILTSAPEGKCDDQHLQDAIHNIIPDIQPGTIRAAMDRLAKRGLCRPGSKVYTIPGAQRARLASALVGVEHDIDAALGPLIERASTVTGFDEAAQGRAERNTRRTLADLVRSTGPQAGEHAATALQVQFDKLSDACWTSLEEGLTRQQAEALVCSLEEFLADPSHAEFIASLVRAYSVLAACHVDPVGLEYSSRAFRDRHIFIDTDTLLVFLLEELPESASVREGLSALKGSGAFLHATYAVLSEVANHLEISHKTYNALPGLKNYPVALAEAKINNALVRAFYFSAEHDGSRFDFDQFRSKYYDSDDPQPFLRELIARIGIELQFQPPGTREDLAEDEALVADRLTVELARWKETRRLKFPYRSVFEMESRARTDAVQALLASHEHRTAVGRTITGLVASDDSAYVFVTKLNDWEGRPKVQLRRSLLPGLAEILGSSVPDAALARLLWSPIAILTARALAEDIDVIARNGVDLRKTGPVRLARDLQAGLHGKLDIYRKSHRPDRRVNDRVLAVYELHQELQRLGYSPDRQVHDIVAGLADAENRAVQGADAVEQMRALLRRLVSDAQSTKKSRRRIRRITSELGLAELLNPPDQASAGGGDG